MHQKIIPQSTNTNKIELIYCDFCENIKTTNLKDYYFQFIILLI